ncbi:glucodextranase DOMON-like domain-containing protein, partial [Thermococcus sp.]
MKSKELKGAWQEGLKALPLIILMLGSLLWFSVPVTALNQKPSNAFWVATYTTEGGLISSMAYGGSPVFTGWLNGAGVKHSDAWVVKLSDDGSIIWQKAVNETSGGSYGLNSIESAGDGYIAVGWVNGAGLKGYDTWVVKFDGSGKVIWQKAIGGEGDQRAEAIASDLIAGTENGKPFAINFNPNNGSINWQEILTGDGKYEVTYALKDYKYYYLIGWVNGAGISGKDGWVAKLSPTGKVYWQKAIGGEGDQVATAITHVAKGTFLAVKASKGTYIVKFDYYGHFKWAKFYPEVSINALTTVGDEVIAAGSYEGNPLVMKLDQGGAVIKAVVYVTDAPSYFTSVKVADGTVYLGGRMGSQAFAMAVPLGSLRIPVCKIAKEISVSAEDSNVSIVSTSLSPENPGYAEIDTNATFVDTKASPSYIKLMKELFSVSDAVGDDHGPGNYTYPTDPVFNQTGLFDITGMTVYETPDSYIVSVHFKNLGGNPWNGPNGFSLQILELYFDYKPGGNTSAIKLASNGPGANVNLNRPWDVAVRVTGWTNKLVFPNMSTVNIMAKADLSTNTINVIIPKKYLKITPDTFYAVFAGSQDGFGIDEWRDVQVKAAQWRIGGGDSDAIIAGVAPRVMDL